MKVFKVTVSGDYRTATGDVIDFDNVVGIMPKCQKDWVLSHVQNRFIGDWIRADARYTKRFDSFRSVYVDNIEEVDGELSCIGKDIKELSWDELRDLAVMKNLYNIPIKHRVDLRTARDTAYFEFNEKVLGRKLKNKHGKMRDGDGMWTVTYDFNKLPSLVVEGEEMADQPVQKSNAQILQEAQDRDVSDDGDDDFTMEELIELAKQRGIKHHPQIGFKKLKEKLFHVEQ